MTPERVTRIFTTTDYKGYFLQHLNTGKIRFGTRNLSSGTGPYNLLDSPAPIPLNDWTHIVAVRKANKLNLYLNNILEGELDESSITDVSSLADFKIGKFDEQTSPPRFHGKIDEVQIYNRALADDEVKELYDEGQSQTNNPPVAQCSNIVVLANDICQGCGSIDNGSYDPDGDAITIVEEPGCNYDLGETTVTLTVTDDKGASASCTGTVTVVDDTVPTILSNAPATITPPDAPITFTSTVEDNCEVTIKVVDYDCYKYTKKGKRIDKTGSCVVEFGEETVTIVDSGGVDDHIKWTVMATDSSGNSITETFEVLVVNPGKGKK